MILLSRASWRKDAISIGAQNRPRPGFTPSWRTKPSASRFHSLCSDFSSGTGKIFIARTDSVDEYPSIPSLDWAPTQTVSKHTVMYRLSLSSGEWLERLYRNVPSDENLSPEQKQWIEVSTSGILRIHESMMNHLKAQIPRTNQSS
jgi:hypothetical protein